MGECVESCRNGRKVVTPEPEFSSALRTRAFQAPNMAGVAAKSMGHSTHSDQR